MDGTHESDTNNALPRGLITRRGSSRLPSLRGDCQGSLSRMASTTAPVTTKGGVLKRTFKPTIPQRRTNEDNCDDKTNNESHSKGRRGRHPKANSHPNNRSKANDSKNWIQTEGAVFRGEDNPHLRSSRAREESSITRKRITNGNDYRIKSEDKSEDKFDDKSTNSKIDNKAKIICKLYGDNFIDDSDSVSDKHVLYPKGWHTVSTRHHSSMTSTVEPLNPYNLLKTTESQDKLVLMQISEEFLKRGNGYIGKMRVYKSGRIELCDSESDIKFDVIFDQNLNSTQSIVKQENGSRVSNRVNDNCMDDISEDVVAFSDNSLCVLSELEHKQVLLAVPQLPHSDHPS